MTLDEVVREADLDSSLWWAPLAVIQDEFGFTAHRRDSTIHLNPDRTACLPWMTYSGPMSDVAISKTFTSEGWTLVRLYDGMWSPYSPPETRSGT